MLFDDPDFEETLASVLVPVAVPVAYTYKVPPGETVVPGTIVKVPLGPREVIGAVWDGEPDAAINPKKLKRISRVYDTTPPLDTDLRRFVNWVANWTLGAPGMVLRMVLRSEEALEPEAPVPGVRRSEGAEPDRQTAARRRVLGTMEDGSACHGDNLEGIQDVGAPSLMSANYLYGNSLADIKAQIANPRNGVMPGWVDRLDPATVKSLTVYVHSFGGGQ